MASFTREQDRSVSSIKHDEWEAELDAHDILFDMLKARLPRELHLRREMLHLDLGA